MKTRHLLLTAALLAVASHTAWAQAPATPTAPQAKDATAITRAANQAARAQMPLNDKQSFDDAKRGLIESATDQLILGPHRSPCVDAQRL